MAGGVWKAAAAPVWSVGGDIRAVAAEAVVRAAAAAITREQQHAKRRGLRRRPGRVGVGEAADPHGLRHQPKRLGAVDMLGTRTASRTVRRRDGARVTCRVLATPPATVLAARPAAAGRARLGGAMLRCCAPPLAPSPRGGASTRCHVMTVSTKDPARPW